MPSVLELGAQSEFLTYTFSSNKIKAPLQTRYLNPAGKPSKGGAKNDDDELTQKFFFEHASHR
jgi:hypothetical protein